MKKRGLQGFTLPELMIVIAIIGILAAIAMPVYRDNAIRAKMSEVILAGSACRTSITLTIQSSAALPGNDNWGCEASGVSGSTHYVNRVNTLSASGASSAVKIIITAQNISPAVDNMAVQLRACKNASATSAASCDDVAAGGNVGTWLCGPNTPSLKQKYLPAYCHTALF